MHACVHSCSGAVVYAGMRQRTSRGTQRHTCFNRLLMWLFVVCVAAVYVSWLLSMCCMIVYA